MKDVSYERRVCRPIGIGVDVSTKYLAIAGVEKLGVSFFYGIDISKLDRINRIFAVERACSKVFDQYYKTVRVVRIESPFGRNITTCKKLHELSTAALIAFYREDIVDFVDNMIWKSKQGIKKVNPDDDIKVCVREWVHKTFPGFKGTPDEIRTITKGKKSGEIERSVNDIYDAVAIARFGWLG